MTALRAYLGDPQLKEDFLGEMRSHLEQDQFVRGVYGQENGVFKGCFIGCALHSLYGLGRLKAKTWGAHSRFPALLGVPVGFARLADAVFEGLSEDDSKWWAEAFPAAIVTGSNLDRAWHRVVARTLREVAEFDKKKFPDVDMAVEGMAALHDLKAEGKAVPAVKWEAEAAWAAGAAGAAEAAAWKRIALIVVEEVSKESAVQA